MSRKTVQVGIDCEVGMPTIPNFIRMTAGGQQATFPVHVLTESELRKLGAEWTEELVAHAHKLRLKAVQNV